MRWTVAYATGEGQTARVATALADRLRSRGEVVALVELRSRGAAPELADADRVVVAGSVHTGRFARRLVRFCRQRGDALAARRAVLVVVSLTAAGDDAAEHAGLARCVAAFERATAWRPAAVHHVAGRLAFTRYGPIKRWLMRRIARAHGLDVTGREDVELTDWAAVRRLADELAASGG